MPNNIKCSQCSRDLSKAIHAIPSTDKDLKICVQCYQKEGGNSRGKYQGFRVSHNNLYNPDGNIDGSSELIIVHDFIKDDEVEFQTKAQRIGLLNLFSGLKDWEIKAKVNLKNYVANFQEGRDRVNWNNSNNDKCCKKCVPGDPPDDYLQAPREKYHLKSTNKYGDEITYNHVCQKDDRKKGKNEKKLLLQSFNKLERYYLDNSIKSITFCPRTNEIVIERDNNTALPSPISPTELPTEIQPVITSYFANGNTSLTHQQLQTMISQLQSEINSHGQQPDKTNYLPYILGGIGLVVVIIGIVWLVNKNKKIKK